MGMHRCIALVLFLAIPSSASVHLSVMTGPAAPAALKFTEEAAARLLEAPVRSSAPGRLDFTAASWKAGRPAAEREAELVTLRAFWGAALSIREDAPPSGGASSAPLPPAFEARARAEELRARLAGFPVPLDKSGQDLLHDGGRSAQGSFVAVDSPLRRPDVATAPAASRLKPAPPAPPAPAAADSGISWKKAGVEMLKGAGKTITDVFTWKGLAVAACSVALVTVAPVAIYGLLALGAAFSVWTIGKAVVDGRKAYKADDPEKFYAASREMGRGVLALGLTVMGARHLPTNLRPHFPSTSGEWRAMAAAMDDEPVIAVSLLRGKTEKH